MDIRKLQAEADQLATLAKNGELSAEQETRFDEVLDTLENRKAQAEKAARAVSLTEATAIETTVSEEAPASSMGAAFVRATAGTSRTRTERVEVRAAITTGDLVINPTLVNVAPVGVRSPLAGIVNIEPVSTNSVETVVEVPAYGANSVAEGDLKPETTIDFVPSSFVLETVANWTDASRQALSDEARLASIIDGTLRNGLVKKSENKIATAITSNASITTSSAGSLQDAIRFGIAAVETNGYTPTAVLVNPTDIAVMDVTIAGGFRALDRNNTIWGLTVVTSNDVPAGTAFVGDFASAVTWFTRGATEVYTTDADADKFRRNIITILAELRAKAVVVRPAAIVKAQVVVAP